MDTPQGQATQEMTEMTMDKLCTKYRAELEKIGRHIFGVNKFHSMFHTDQKFVDEHGEIHANLMLAYRHIEDARMRLGKVFQAMDGGKSVYPK